MDGYHGDKGVRKYSFINVTITLKVSFCGMKTTLEDKMETVGVVVGGFIFMAPVNVMGVGVRAHDVNRCHVYETTGTFCGFVVFWSPKMTI